MILYLSVLLHEASHAVMARRLGFPVGSITLHFLGGMTSIEGEARKPRQEFLIAVVGPLTSLAVGVVALGLWFITPDGLLLVAVEGLAGANLLVGLLNLIPGLPLDGGRVLKSLVWQVSGNVHRGTIVAGWAGRVTAVAAMLWPVAAVAGHRRRADHPRLRARVRRRGVPLVRRDGRDVGGPAAEPAAAPGRPPARPPYPRRPRGPAARRGRTPGAGGRRPGA